MDEIINLFLYWFRNKIFSNFSDTLWSTLFGGSKDKKLSFKCSTDLRNFLICIRKFKASLFLPFRFRHNPFCRKCCALMLSLRCNCKADRRLLTWWTVKFSLPWSYQIMCLDNMNLEFGCCFQILNFSVGKSSTVFLDWLVVASLACRKRIKYSGSILIIGIM